MERDIVRVYHTDHRKITIIHSSIKNRKIGVIEDPKEDTVKAQFLTKEDIKMIEKLDPKGGELCQKIFLKKEKIW